MEQETPVKVLIRCKSRVKEEAIQMGTRMQYVYGHWLDTYVHPKAIESSQRKESASTVGISVAIAKILMMSI